LYRSLCSGGYAIGECVMNAGDYAIDWYQREIVRLKERITELEHVIAKLTIENLQLREALLDNVPWRTSLAT